MKWRSLVRISLFFLCGHVKKKKKKSINVEEAFGKIEGAQFLRILG